MWLGNSITPLREEEWEEEEEEEADVPAPASPPTSPVNSRSPICPSFLQFEVSSGLFDLFGVLFDMSVSSVCGGVVAPLVSLCRKHRAGVDIHSCSQFLLELYSRWILPSGSARRTPIILISEVVRSVSSPSLLPHRRSARVVGMHALTHPQQYRCRTQSHSPRSLGTWEGALSGL